MRPSAQWTDAERLRIVARLSALMAASMKAGRAYGSPGDPTIETILALAVSPADELEKARETIEGFMQEAPPASS